MKSVQTEPGVTVLASWLSPRRAATSAANRASLVVLAAAAAINVSNDIPRPAARPCLVHALELLT